jgi:hypothetical protein
MNNPHKNSMGNLKKFENVWASNTSRTATAINKPRKVEVTAIRRTLRNAEIQLIPERLVRNDAKMTGIAALTIPNKIAPVVFASINRLRSIGASNSRSNERCLLSNVIVTASIDVVPNRIDIDITPGRMPRISIAVSDLTKNITVQATGKMIPQLMLGGLR